MANILSRWINAINIHFKSEGGLILLNISHLQRLIPFIGLMGLFSWLPFAHAETDCGSVTEIPQVECEALLDLYHSTDGPNWKNNTGWHANNTPCNWYGVSCRGGYVTSIYLHYNQVSGTIPESLGNLSNLTNLRLSYGQLTGSIPESLGNLSNLQFLYLYLNQLSGTIPESLGNLNNLQVLYLYNNQLSGSLPESLGNLSNLQNFHLGNNQLSNPIPESLGNLNCKNSV